MQKITNFTIKVALMGLKKAKIDGKMCSYPQLLYEYSIVILLLLVNHFENFFERGMQNYPDKFKIVNSTLHVKLKEQFSPILSASQVLCK